MKVLVCGGRDLERRHYRFLERVLDLLDVSAIVSGGAPGADSLASLYASENNIPIFVYPAKWHKFGWGAGPKRNQAMLDEQDVDLVVAMPGGRGTADMKRRALEKGVPVVTIEK